MKKREHNIEKESGWKKKRKRKKERKKLIKKNVKSWKGKNREQDRDCCEENKKERNKETKNLNVGKERT